MRALVVFPDSEKPNVDEVGGKGHSLIRMAQAGLPVPPGVVLTASFFTPWFDDIKATATWRALAHAGTEEWSTLCQQLQRLCSALLLTDHQRRVLEQCRQALASGSLARLFAVRSSSPEEDLASASFAGGYETRLGVGPADLEGAVRGCFASTFGERVLVYKRARGFDVLSPRIAVVVQQQIASDVAGVGFSLNPLTNDYDEAVIDACWGLGEPLVSGRVSPDHFIVDKVSRQVVERRLGAKRTSSWLDPAGGTLERLDHRASELTLSDAQLVEATDLLCRIEGLYQQPTDIEWAWADGRFHVLQARPITTFVPLPPELVTKPGARRRLYMDASLADGLTINKPISPMGLDWIEDLVSAVAARYAGPVQIDATPEEGLFLAAGGRLYSNISTALWLQSAKALAEGRAQLSSLQSETLAGVDLTYRSARRPSWMRLWTLRLVPRILWGLGPFLWNTVTASLTPARAFRAYQRKVDAYEESLLAFDYSLPLDRFLRTYTPPMVRHVMDTTLPTLGAFVLALASLDRMLKGRSAEAKALAEKLKLGFPGNVVVEMGHAMFRLARLAAREDFADVNQFAERIARRDVSAEFLRAWDEFLSRYGSRGPMEMDVASPRYADDPRLALRQMSFMAVDDGGFDPGAAHERHVRERRQAFNALLPHVGWLRQARLRRIHTVIELLAGTRDTPKYHLVLFNYALRKRALMEGQRLVADGRLDAAEHVFDLRFRDIEASSGNSSLDLRQLRSERTPFLQILEAQVRTFPSLIDSRGRILRAPPRPETPGELKGIAISNGVARGPVKVLHDPYEKPVEKGDVLVAYTTDPGWTPLFVNAAAVVLEVGGMLQHGAVVAREYGKPCVAGIEAVMTRLRDAQRVEVDGTAGVVRLLS